MHLEGATNYKTFDQVLLLHVNVYTQAGSVLYHCAGLLAGGCACMLGKIVEQHYDALEVAELQRGTVSGVGPFHTTYSM